MQDLVERLRQLSEEWQRLTGDSSEAVEADPPGLDPVPYREYMTPILVALDSLGGEAATGAVLEQIGEALGSRFSAADLGRLKSGGKVWVSRASYARTRLIKKGLLDGEAPTGTWRITEAGRAWLQERVVRGERMGSPGAQ